MAQFFFGRFLENVSVKSDPRVAVERQICVKRGGKKSPKRRLFSVFNSSIKN